MKCQNCKINEAEYELVGSKCCRACWHEYWQDNDIGEDTSFEEKMKYKNNIPHRKGMVNLNLLQKETKSASVDKSYSVGRNSCLDSSPSDFNLIEQRQILFNKFVGIPHFAEILRR